MREPKNICIVGTGYVGMASAVGFAELGHRVTGYDISIERVRALQQGITPYREAGIEEPLARHLASGRIRFYETLAPAVAQADFVIIAVGTPARADGSADLSAVGSSIEALARLAPAHTILVLRSTVPAGTTEEFAQRSGRRFVYAPEFLREGSALVDFLNPDRIVVGSETEAAAADYASLLASLEKPVIATTYRNAELIKAFSNAFLAMKISFANEVANMCDLLHADAGDVLRGIGHDRRIGTAFLMPGIGFGGPCFEKDVKSLHYVASELKVGNELLGATLRVNEYQPKHIVDVLEAEVGGSLSGVRVAVWGLTFKAGTDDVRDSLALRIVDDLISRGAKPQAFDPSIEEAPPEVHCELASSALAALTGAEALLVLTEWPVFAEVSPWAIAGKLQGRVVVDGRNILDPTAIAAVGLRYRGVGRRSSTARDLAVAG